jgi:hypothetical protein
MSWLSDFFRKLRGKAPKNPQPEAPPVAVPQPVAPPVTPPPVAVAPQPVTPAPTPVTPRPVAPAPTVTLKRGFFEPDGVNYTLNPPVAPAGMVYPAVGVWMSPGTVTPVPVFSLTPVPKSEVKITWGAGDPYPKIVHVGGANILAKAPINGSWKPSMNAETFGGANHPNGDPKSFVWDPSNAPNGYALRSPGGYPLYYPNVNWDAATEQWVVSPGMNIGTPTIIFGEHNGFKTDAEVDSWVAASAAQDEALRQWDIRFNKTYFLGPVSSIGMSKNDMVYLYSKVFDYLMVVPNGDIFRTVLSGFQKDINRAINASELEHIQAQGATVAPDNPALRVAVEQAFAAAAAGTPLQPKYEVR